MTVLNLPVTSYVCPMHAEIVRAEPGACPLCGMTLELRGAVADDEPTIEPVHSHRRLRSRGTPETRGSRRSSRPHARRQDAVHHRQDPVATLGDRG